MKKTITIILIIISFNSFSQQIAKEDLKLISDFSTMHLPVVFETEDYHVYDFFDNQRKWNPKSDELVKIKTGQCDFRKGFKITLNNKYFAIVYPRTCGDSLTYLLSTIDEDGKLISNLEVMSLLGDDHSMNGYISKELDIKLIFRSLLPIQNMNKADIKVSEREERFITNENGEIKKILRTKDTIRFYNINAKGMYVIVK
ncbi:hypothetical protein ACFLU5_03925 [Bacteroidota bacterium]